MSKKHRAFLKWSEYTYTFCMKFTSYAFIFLKNMKIDTPSIYRQPPMLALATNNL